MDLFAGELCPIPALRTYAFAAEVLRAVEGQLREVRIDRLAGTSTTPPLLLPDPQKSARWMRGRVTR